MLTQNVVDEGVLSKSQQKKRLREKKYILKKEYQKKLKKEKKKIRQTQKILGENEDTLRDILCEKDSERCVGMEKKKSRRIKNKQGR
jgi:predicted phage gp36 major capsid-like protein